MVAKKKRYITPWLDIENALSAILSNDRDFEVLHENDYLSFKAILKWALEKNKGRIRKSIQNIQKGRGVIIPFDLLVNLARAYTVSPMTAEIKELASRTAQLIDEGIHERDLVLFLGAGISFDSEVGWQSIQGALAQSLEITPGEVEKRLDEDFFEPFRDLRTRGKVDEFQDVLSRYITNRHTAQPNEAHTLIADLLNEKRVEHLVCFNWDDFIEDEYTKKTGEKWVFRSTEESLSGMIGYWKPHGCVTNSRINWVLPCDPINLPTRFLDDIANKSLRTVLCLGFAGGSNFTQDELIAWFGTGTFLYDIRPNVDEGSALGTSICHSAGFVLKQITDELNKAQPRQL